STLSPRCCRVDAVNTSRVSAGSFAFSRRVSAFLQVISEGERGRVETTAAFALLVLGLPGPGWTRRSRRRGQASGGPDRVAAVGGLDGGAVGTCCSRAGRSKGGLCCRHPRLLPTTVRGVASPRP